MGLVVMLGLIAWVYASGDVSGERNTLNDKNSKVNSRLTKPDREAVFSSRNPLVYPKNVERAKERDAWKGPKNEGSVYNLPLDMKVRTTGDDVDEFTQYDTNGDGFWDEDEFDETPYPDGGGDKAKFENWDRSGDGVIDRPEHAAPPVEAKELFDKLDKNNDGVLTEDEFPQLKEADTDQSGDVDLEEFNVWNAGGRATFKKTGLVTDVTARIDANAMKVVVSWTEPEIEESFVPEDLQYIIYASSPEDRAKRDREYAVLVVEYRKEHDAWKARFRKWRNQKSEEVPEKTNGQVYGRGAEKKYGETDPEPQPPVKPSEWNEVTRVSGATVEIPFLLGATYRYAVSTITSANLLKDNHREFVKKTHDDGTQETAQVEQTTAPVRMENRVTMEFKSKSGEGGTINLGTWIANAAGDYFWITIDDAVTVDDPDIGGVYSISQIKGMKPSANNGDVEIDVAFEGLESSDKIDFTPYANIPRAEEAGKEFTFETVSGKGFLISARGLPDYHLNKSARGPISHAAGEGDTQVRCLLVSKGKSIFEVSTWVESEGNWYLAVLVTEVKDGKEIGSTVNLSASAKGLTIYNEKGAAVSKGPAIDIDLSAGTFDGIEGRMISTSEGEFDVFGVLFK
jgi:hypothetical protein